jgi:hypothetical protein
VYGDARHADVENIVIYCVSTEISQNAFPCSLGPIRVTFAEVVNLIEAGPGLIHKLIEVIVKGEVEISGEYELGWEGTIAGVILDLRQNYPACEVNGGELFERNEVVILNVAVDLEK